MKIKKLSNLSKPFMALILTLIVMVSFCVPAYAALNGGGHDQNLTPEQQEQINQATEDYDRWHNSGLPADHPDRIAGEQAAHDKAEAARNEGGSYSGGVDGTQYIPFPGGGGSSGDSGYYNDPTTYTISATAGTGGSISPSGSTSVTEGSNKSYTITANAGYKIADVKVDGSSIGVSSTYSFSGVSSSHSISATFTSAASLCVEGVMLGDGGSGTLKSGVTKSGYGITVSMPISSSCVSGTTVTASYNFTSAKTVSLENVGGTWQFPVNSNSITGARKIYIPVETKDGTYTITFTVKALDPQATALNGSNVYLTAKKSVTITIDGSMYDDDATGES